MFPSALGGPREELARSGHKMFTRKLSLSFVKVIMDAQGRALRRTVCKA